MKLCVASPQRTMLDVRREPARPVERTPRQRLNDVRAAYQRRRLDSLLLTMRELTINGESKWN